MLKMLKFQSYKSNIAKIFAGFMIVVMAIMAFAPLAYADNGKGKNKGNGNGNGNGKKERVEVRTEVRAAERSDDDNDDDDDDDSKGRKDDSEKFRKFENKFFNKFFRNFLLPPGIAKKIRALNGGNNGTTTPGTDTTAPLIRNLLVRDITDSSARVIWNTDERANGKVWFSTSSPATGSGSVILNANSDYNHEHKAKLTGLATSTKYYVIVTSADRAGNTATSSETSFTTLSGTTTPPGGDVTAPEIHGLTSYNVTKTSADIAWVTTERGDTRVFYSTSTPVVATSTTSSAGDSDKVYFHHVKLTGLATSTTYYFLAQSTDNAGNVGTSSQMSFTTMSDPDTTDPVISSVQATSTASTSASVTWNTDEPATGAVWYGTTTPVVLALPTLSVSTTTLGTSHSFSIADLATSTTYYYTVVSADSSGNSDSVTGGSFVTLP